MSLQRMTLEDRPAHISYSYVNALLIEPLKDILGKDVDDSEVSVTTSYGHFADTVWLRTKYDAELYLTALRLPVMAICSIGCMLLFVC